MSETWIRGCVATADLPKEPWHLVTSWLTQGTQKIWTTACGLTIEHDVEETKNRETVERETTCFNCHAVHLRDTEPEISSEPLEEDYEPKVMDPDHVNVTRDFQVEGGERVGRMMTPAIDPDQEQAAFVEGWMAGATFPFTATDTADRAIALQAYFDWKRRTSE